MNLKTSASPPHHLATNISMLIIASLLAFPMRIEAISDTSIQITEAIRGQTYIETITVANPDGQKNRLAISADGEISQWIRFYDSPNAVKPLVFLNIPAKSAGIVTAKITIPEDAAERTYIGNITAAVSPENTAGLAIPQAGQEVMIRVGNKKIIAFDASITPENSTVERGNILKIKTVYKNRSNIKISPRLEIKIKKDGQGIYSAIFPYPDNLQEIIPNLSFEIPPLEIPTDNIEPGKYEAFLIASEGNEYVLEKKFDFTVAASTDEENPAAASASATLNNIFPAANTFPPPTAPLAAAIAAYAAFVLLRKTLLYWGIKIKSQIRALVKNKDRWH